MILTTEEDRQYAHLLFRLMHLKPVDREVYRNVPQPREHILVKHAAMRCNTKLIRRLANTVNPPRGMD